MTGETAAIAEPPQMPVPTPISVRRSRGMPSSRPYSQAAPRQTARVPSMTGSEDTPTRAASPIESWAPSSTTEHCRTNVLAHFRPGARRAPGLIASAMTAPMTAPGTALPTSGTCCPTTVGDGRDGEREREAGEDGARLRGERPRGAGEVTAAGQTGGRGSTGAGEASGAREASGAGEASGASDAAAASAGRGRVTAFMALPGSPAC